VIGEQMSRVTCFFSRPY